MLVRRDHRGARADTDPAAVSAARCDPPGAGPFAGGGGGGGVGTVGTVGVGPVGGVGTLGIGTGTLTVGTGTLTVGTGLVTVGRLGSALAGETSWPMPNPAHNAHAATSDIRLVASLATTASGSRVA